MYFTVLPLVPSLALPLAPGVDIPVTSAGPRSTGDATSWPALPQHWTGQTYRHILTVLILWI